MNKKILHVTSLLLIFYHFSVAHAEDSSNIFQKFDQFQSKQLKKALPEKTEKEAEIPKPEPLAQVVEKPLPKKTVHVSRKQPKSASHQRAPSSDPAELPKRQIPARINPDEPTKTAEVTRPSEEAPAVGADSLFGDWHGFRKILADKGLDLSLIYKGEVSRNLSGGVAVKTAYLENLDLRFSVDAEKLLGLKGTSFFVYALGDKGADSGNVPSKNVGDAQGTSNIETKVDDFRIYELWVQKLLFEDRVSMLVGMHDLNSEFYVTESSSLFFNASFGVGRELSQTGINGPSIFPYTAPAVRLRIAPTKNFYLQTALFQAKAGDPDHLKGTYLNSDTSLGHIFITEAAILNESMGGAAKYAIGEWSYSHTFDHLTQTLTDDHGNSVPAPATSFGFYFLADQPLTSDMSVFLRYGKASAQTNNFETCMSSGVVIKNPLPGRAKDKLGFGIAAVTPGSEYVQSQRNLGTELKPNEITYELNYRIEVASGIALQPDFQYIQNPGLSTSIDNSQYGSIRIELNF